MSSSSTINVHASSAGEHATDATSHKKVNRLPHTMKPKHYQVVLTPNLTQRTFTGQVDLTFQLTEPTQTILLNSVELVIQSAQLLDCYQLVASKSIELNETDEIVTITFEKLIPAGEHVLQLSYTGILNDQMRGFYASSYTDSNGVEQTLATTQFEATDCRRAIPSVDEPAAKATFGVTLICPSKMQALSNMPVQESRVEEGSNGELTRHTFEKTPIMSTYLLAFVVGVFDKIEATTDSGTLIRCFATPGKGEQNRFALEVAVKLLPFYNNWFDEPYPLPKLDMIAVPDFAAGAMENWGLITYREAALLLDPANSSAQTKQWVAVCVAHEIAHQWFGNLVTMEWWTHLWLNEGFATWMENYAVDYLFPEWKMWEQFVYSDLNSAFDLDSLENSHAIEVPIYHASETDEIFDTISYCKGCVVIRMVAAFLGPEDFRAGLVKYIKKFKYSNAFTEDLWAVLSEVSGKDVKAMMNAWTRHTGFPIVELEEVPSKEEGVLQFTATQTRFLQTGPDRSSTELWPVPINFLIAGQKGPAPVGSQVFNTKTGTLKVDLKSLGIPSTPAWIKLNAAQAAMYRVRYPPHVFAALCHAVSQRDPLLTPPDRLGVQNDAFALTRCGLLSTVQLLELVQSYQNEDDYTVWADLCSNLSDVSILVQTDRATYDLFAVYVQRLLSKILVKVGWEKTPNEDHTTSLLRAKVIGVAAKYGHPETIKTALAKFEEPNLEPDLRGTVYGVVVNQGGKAGYEKLLALGEKATLSEEQVRCLNALGCSNEPDLLIRTLDSALSPTVRTQDGPTLIQVVAGNKIGSKLCWDYCRTHWDEILKKYQQSSSLSRIVSQIGNFTSRGDKATIDEFFKTHAHPGAERAVKQGIERIESNAQWFERDFEKVKEFLKANQQ